MSSIGESIQKLRDRLQSFGKKGGGGGASAGGKPKVDGAAILAWVKANPVIVASCAVMVAAPAAAWWFSSDMHAAADAEASKRAQEYGALEKLEKSSIELAVPGREPEQLSGVISRRTVQAYQDVAEKLRADAMSIQDQALRHNRGSRERRPIDVRVTRENNNTIAERVFGAVMSQADEDLKQLRAGSPPSAQELVDQLQRAQDQFIGREQKPDRKSLSDEQSDLLRAQLVERRLQLCADAARNVALYAERDDLGLPQSAAEVGKEPTEPVLFGWQWRLWIVEDVLDALASANAPYKSVIEGPVKRIVSVTVREDPALAPKATEGGDKPLPTGEEPAPTEALKPIDPKDPVAYDFSRSITGRTSNHLYEVRPVSLRIVVSTPRIPEVLNAISRHNLMTVTSFDMRPADAFAAAADGFVYGAEPVSEVRMTVETIWLRSWLAKMMPREVQVAKGTDGRTVDDPPEARPDDGGAGTEPST